MQRRQTIWFARVLMYLLPHEQITTAITFGFSIHFPSFLNVFAIGYREKVLRCELDLLRERNAGRLLLLENELPCRLCPKPRCGRSSRYVSAIGAREGGKDGSIERGIVMRISRSMSRTSRRSSGVTNEMA